MVGHGGSSAGSYLADPTSPIPSHCASIVVTSTVRVKNPLIDHLPDSLLGWPPLSTIDYFFTSLLLLCWYTWWTAGIFLCQNPELNQGPLDLQSNDLPTEFCLQPLSIGCTLHSIGTAHCLLCDSEIEGLMTEFQVFTVWYGIEWGFSW